jgi:hypothetical protein
MDKDEEKLTRLLIKTHDYFGLCDRWIKIRSYRGGLSPKLLVQASNEISPDLSFSLFLMKEIYEADIGSVSILRWLLGLTPLLEKIIYLEK